MCDKDAGDVVQREDDRPEAVRRRLELYDKATRPLLAFYERLKLLARVDGVGQTDEIFERVLEAVDGLHRQRHSAPWYCSCATAVG